MGTAFKIVSESIPPDSTPHSAITDGGRWCYKITCIKYTNSINCTIRKRGGGSHDPHECKPETGRICGRPQPGDLQGREDRPASPWEGRCRINLECGSGGASRGGYTGGLQARPRQKG